MKQKLHTILVIDDDEATNFFTRMMLEESDFAENVETLESGKKALDYLSMSEIEAAGGPHPGPELIFLDINMPAMNGWEFLEEFKKLHVKNRIIIVMLTTSLFPEDRLKAEAMKEISGFEHKPLTPEKVAAVLEKYFPKEEPKNVET